MIHLQALPYTFKDLTPFISERTMYFHYEKHYAGYVNTTNNLLKETDLQDKTLEQIILTAASDDIYTTLFNNAAQVWNHEFFWRSLTPQLQTIPASLSARIDKDFGSLTQLQDTLIKKGLAQFGSGWVWLVADKQNLRIMTTSNAQTPLTTPNLKPLLCLDVWEHAYYLDYQNLRKDYLTQIVQHCLNWEFAVQNLTKC
ncbi:MAG: superoxide dismutase [Alphaproteobacteria bacterium]|nr:superoxide dismutase [Alphaproteobacteria bacterium]